MGAASSLLILKSASSQYWPENGWSDLDLWVHSSSEEFLSAPGSPLQPRKAPYVRLYDKRKRSVQSQMPFGYGAGELPTARMRSFSRLSSVALPETRQPCSQGRAELCDSGRFTAIEEFGALTGVIAMHTTTGGTAAPPRGAHGR